MKQTLEIESHALAGADPKIEDFNNDGLKDITFRSNTAARGSNDVRTLLIYDKTNDVLVHVKNSEDYPNLAYNKALKCIDSWMVHGASTTVFLRLEGDLLKEFASVGTGANRDGNCCALTVRITEKAGKETVIRRKRITEDDIYTRFRTFDPPQP
ncbi:MAG: XAC2610-related protein [Blastocatellia bacterium]